MNEFEFHRLKSLRPADQDCSTGQHWAKNALIFIWPSPGKMLTAQKNFTIIFPLTTTLETMNGGKKSNFKKFK